MSIVFSVPEGSIDPKAHRSDMDRYSPDYLLLVRLMVVYTGDFIRMGDLVSILDIFVDKMYASVRKGWCYLKSFFCCFVVLF